WIEHMRANGFTVKVVHQADLTPIRVQHHVPRELMSCHTAVIDGFAIEGHVPADAVQRLLEERPKVLGIAVPGMPAGTPGMERRDGSTEPYEVYTSDASGAQAVFQFSN